MQQRAASRLAEVTLEAWGVVSDAVANEQPADRALQKFFGSRRELGARDRRFIGNTLFSRFRWRGWLRTTERTERAQLALAAAMDADAPHPAADALDETAARAFPSGFASLSLAEKAAAFASSLGLAAPPAPVLLVPEWVVHRILPDSSDAAAISWIESIQSRVPLWLRCRPGAEPRIVEALSARGIASQVDTRIPGAVRVDGNPPLAELRRQSGVAVEAQDIASQAVIHACAAQPGQLWLDRCAGAGGKTLALAEAVGPKGRVIATDPRADALEELQRRADAAGLRNIRIEPAPPALRYDGILIDAPCTGTGTWGRSPDARWRTTPDELTRCTSIQRELLREASSLASNPTRIIYATCSILSDEGPATANPARRPHASPLPIPSLGTRPTPHSLLIPPCAGPGIGMFIASV